MSQFIRIALAIGAASLAAACNTASPDRVSGPWGVGFVSDNGPRYSEPWNSGPLVIVEPEQFIDAGGVDPIFRDVTPDPYRVGVTFPSDPQPQPMPPPYQQDLPPPDGGDMEQGATIPVAPSEPAVPRSNPTPAPAAPQQAVAPTASGFAGTWTAIDATGKRCKILLSSSTAVDRYRASASGCSAGELGSINMWNYSNGAVTLYARDKTVARLSGRRDHLTGNLAGTKGAVDLTR